MCSVVAERNERCRAVNAAAAATDPVLLPTRSPRCRDTRSANYAITEILPPQSAQHHRTITSDAAPMTDNCINTKDT